jgi:hypothetical protein
MGEKTWLWYFILGIIYIAILVMLVKPGSDAGNAVTSLSNGLSTLIKTAVGAPSTTTVPTGGILT